MILFKYFLSAILVVFATVFCAYAQDTSRIQNPMRVDTLPVSLPDSTEDTNDSGDGPESDEASSLLAKGWSYSLSLSGDYKTGNVQRGLFSINTFLNFESKKSAWGFYTSPRYMKGNVNRQKAENELFVDMNATIFYDSKDIYGLAFGIYETSNLRKINERLYYGVGIGLRIIGGIKHPEAKFKLAITNAILHENTDFQTKEDITTWRNSTRIKISTKLWKDKLELSNTTFLQPSLNQNNFRWNAISQLAIKLSNHLSFVVSEVNSYESVVVEGASNTDFSLTFGFRLSNL